MFSVLGLKYRSHVAGQEYTGHRSIDKLPNHTDYTLDLIEYFVKRLKLGDTFNAVCYSVSW